MAPPSPLDHTLGDLPTGRGRGASGSTLAPGTLAAGRYRIESVLGRGGAGTVYLATDEHLGRRIALKTLHAGAHPAESLGDEARVLAGLAHPNIVVLHELVLDGPLSFAVTELLEGGSLADRVATTGALQVAELIDLATQIGGAIALAHERGILHRDIKPGNVLYTADGVAKISDFGLAQRRAIADPILADPTLAGLGAGTLLYSAPEQLRDAATATVASDVFSLGATLYYAATGDPPHSIRIERVPPALRPALERALELDPARRPAGVRELLALLESARPAPPAHPPTTAPTVRIGGRTYALEGLLGRGDSCDIHAGRWLDPLGERVVIKVLRSLADADLLRREQRVLSHLRASRVQGAEHFVRLLPEPIALDTLRNAADGIERPLAAFRRESGFSWSLAAVMTAHTRAGSAGVPGEAAVWVLKRILELLSFAHRAGVVHGAVLPPHVIVHHRDHGAILAGWSVATRHSPGRDAERLPGISRAWRHLYPPELLHGRVATPTTDIRMAARTVLAAAAPLASPFAELVDQAAGGAFADAWLLRERVTEASRRAYGRPGYNPISLPQEDD